MRITSRLAIVAVLLYAVVCSACSNNTANSKALVIATLLPISGEAAGVGLALQRGVDLAVQQANLGNGYTLTTVHADEIGNPAPLIQQFDANSQIMGIIGPYDSATAKVIIPLVTNDQIATMSPTTTLPGLTQADQASAEGITFASLHPAGKPVAYFRLPENDNALGKVAADLATAPAAAGGVAAKSAFLVDDGSDSGKAQAAAFSLEFKAKKATVAGQKTITLGAQDNSQAVITAIIQAEPDVVFWGGGATSGAKLRDTLSLSGLPQMPIVTGGQVASDPNWVTAVGLPAAAASTLALLSAPDPSTLSAPAAKSAIAAYQAAYASTPLLPQSLMAYDAAMVEIAAIKSIIASGKDVTRGAVIAAIANIKYTGVTGAMAFDANGDNTLALGFALYSCDTAGKWSYKAHLNG